MRQSGATDRLSPSFWRREPRPCPLPIDYYHRAMCRPPLRERLCRGIPREIPRPQSDSIIDVARCMCCTLSLIPVHRTGQWSHLLPIFSPLCHKTGPRGTRRSVIHQSCGLTHRSLPPYHSDVKCKCSAEDYLYLPVGSYQSRDRQRRRSYQSKVSGLSR